MQLRSNLSVLQELDLNKLLAVQSDVTMLIEERVKALQSRSMSAYKSISNGATTVPNDSIDFDNKENLQEYEKASQNNVDSDTDDFLLTQFDQTARERLLKQNTNEIQTEKQMNFEPNYRIPDLSSPLKGTQSLPDSLSSIGNDLQVIPLTVKREPIPNSSCSNILQSANGVTNESFSKRNEKKPKKICLESSAMHAKKFVNFNMNPITKKPWILEDFKPNEDLNSIIRGRKKISNVKLNRFYKLGGRPPNAGIEVKIDEDNDNERSCEFENLRQRSKSPPGFGRLDFPSTQERVDDKKKSQELIYKKTRRRFLIATCNRIPPQEREYVFKSDHLNQIVEEGYFSWNDEKLSIFHRK